MRKAMKALMEAYERHMQMQQSTPPPNGCLRPATRSSARPSGWPLATSPYILRTPPRLKLVSSPLEEPPQHLRALDSTPRPPAVRRGLVDYPVDYNNDYNHVDGIGSQRIHSPLRPVV